MNILELIERETHLPFAKRGREYHGQCPFCRCEGNHFVVFLSGNERYWCRQCDRKGDAVQFLRDYCHYTYQQAKETVGVTVDNDDYHDKNDNHDNHDNRFSNETKPLRSPSEPWINCAAAFVADCQSALWAPTGSKALAWLHKRALVDATIRQAGLGYNPADRWVNRQDWGLPPEMNEQGKPRDLWLPRGIIIPWMIDGELWGVRIRRPAAPGDKLKYYWLPGGTANALYNADAIASGQPVALFEGEIDALSLAQAAGDGCAAVATGSTHAARRVRWIARLSIASSALVCYDSDQAGEQAAHYWIDVLPNARRWRPYWSDANDMARDGVDLHRWVMAGLSTTVPDSPVQPATDVASEPAATLDGIQIGDLTDYIGQDVTAQTWAALQAECARRYGDLWTIYATQTGDVWHITRLHANPEEGEQEPLSLDWMNDDLPVERSITNV